MKKLSLAIVFSVLIASPSFAKEVIADWVKGNTGIVWRATPKDYPDKVTRVLLFPLTLHSRPSSRWSEKRNNQ